MIRGMMRLLCTSCAVSHRAKIVKSRTAGPRRLFVTIELGVGYFK